MTEILTREEVKGVIPPIVTPYKADESVDLERFERELAVMEASGIELIIVGGSTGSGDELSAEDLEALVRIASTRSRLRVISGIITTTTKDAMRRAKLVRDAGASALLLCPPIYNSATEDSLFAFIDDVTKASDLPIIFYDHYNYPVELLKRIAALSQVIAIKCVFQNVAELVHSVGDRVTIAVGYDPITLAGYVMGAEASIAGVHAVLPRENVSVYRAFKSGDLTEAMRLTAAIGPISREVSRSTNFTARIKVAINLLGRNVGDPIRPLNDIPLGDKEAIREGLRYAGVL
jgi:4-hydroxy-tetrahydrodipicolinate synthase